MSEEERKASEAHQAMLVAHGAAPEDEPLTAAIAAYLNLDMVGRLREKLVIQGTDLHRAGKLRFNDEMYPSA